MNPEVVLETSTGKKITFQELTPGEMMDVIEAAAEASPNQVWLRYAICISSIRYIDGKPVKFPKTKIEVRALADRLGHDGMTAAMVHSYGVDKPADAEEDAEGSNPAPSSPEEAAFATAKN